MRRLLIVALLLTACGGEESVDTTAIETATAAAASGATSAAPATNTAAQPAAGAVVVRDAAGAEVVSIREDGGTATITYTVDGEKHVLQGTPRESGKRKYRIDQSAVMFEVKPGDSGFKLRMADGTLRWKVKITADKTKISDNEENKNPYELKVRDGGARVKVVAPGDRELGRVELDRAASKTVVEDAAGKQAFRIEGAPPAGGYGVLLLDAIPPPQRYILLAELISRAQ
jgi:hypothetical protein